MFVFVSAFVVAIIALVELSADLVQVVLALIVVGIVVVFCAIHAGVYLWWDRRSDNYVILRAK